MGIQDFSHLPVGLCPAQNKVKASTSVRGVLYDVLYVLYVRMYLMSMYLYSILSVSLIVILTARTRNLSMSNDVNSL